VKERQREGRLPFRKQRKTVRGGGGAGGSNQMKPKEIEMHWSKTGEKARELVGEQFLKKEGTKPLQRAGEEETRVKGGAPDLTVNQKQCIHGNTGASLWKTSGRSKTVVARTNRKN